MHIPDGFLSPSVAAATWAVAAGSVGLALRAERRESSPMPAGVLGSVAAFLFAAQMINVPVAPGTSGHLVGGTLAAAILGPWRAMLALAAVLAVQALLFQDGGLTAFGANFIDMGIAGPLVGYAVARLVCGRRIGPRPLAAGAIVGAFAATVCGAALASVWLAASGLYPLHGILPVMLVAHVAIGLLEAALTGTVLVTLLQWRPDLANGIGAADVVRRPAALTTGMFGVGLLLAAFAAPFSSALPDGLDRTAQTLGFTASASPSWPRLAILVPAVAGVVGTIVVAFLAWAISRTLAPRNDAAHR